MERVTTLPPIPTREPESHKGTHGRALVIAGSVTMPGAAVLATRAALRAGAGLVTAAIPSMLSPILATTVPEATQLHLDGDAPRCLESLKAACKAQPGYSAIAIGPGLGTGEHTRLYMEWLLGNDRVPLVLDADALNVVAVTPELAHKPAMQRVWTPHPGEFQRLTRDKLEGEEARLDRVGTAASRFGGVWVLKGHRSVIHDGQRYAINSTGNPGMATGGSGDVLTGIIAGLLAQGFEPFHAAHLGAHLHGAAGDLAALQLGEVSLNADDLNDFLPAAILQYQRAP